jgi:hypothetical protein
MDAACRREGWSVQHSTLVLHSNVNAAIKLLQEDAAAVRAHVRHVYGEHLQVGEYSVHVEVSWLGANAHYDVETQVCCSANCQQHIVLWFLSAAEFSAVAPESSGTFVVAAFVFSWRDILMNHAVILAMKRAVSLKAACLCT